MCAEGLHFSASLVTTIGAISSSTRLMAPQPMKLILWLGVVGDYTFYGHKNFPSIGRETKREVKLTVLLWEVLAISYVKIVFVYSNVTTSRKKTITKPPCPPV